MLDETTAPTAHDDHGVAKAVHQATAAEAPEVERPDPGASDSAGTSTENGVVKHLDLAVQAAEEQGMSTSELIGMLFYYAHNLAQDARDKALSSRSPSE